MLTDILYRALQAPGTPPSEARILLLEKIAGFGVPVKNWAKKNPIAKTNAVSKNIQTSIKDKVARGTFGISPKPIYIPKALTPPKLT